MIEITRGNPTSDEVAALVAALILASGTTEERLTSSTTGWRRSTPFAEVNLREPSRSHRRWRSSHGVKAYESEMHGPLFFGAKQRLSMTPNA